MRFRLNEAAAALTLEFTATLPQVGDVTRTVGKRRLRRNFSAGRPIPYEPDMMQISSSLACIATIVLSLLAPGAAVAQPTRAGETRAEREFLVPPQGGAFEIPVHADAVCILSFPDKLSSTALSSSPQLEIKPWGDDGVAVRARSEHLPSATLALATVSKTISVNITLRVVPRQQPALTLVRFKAVSADAAVAAQVDAEVTKRVALVKAELEKVRQVCDARIRDNDSRFLDRADNLQMRRLMQRNEPVEIEAHARNDDHVIVHVRRGFLLGADGYLVFDIENRSRSAYRLATVRVTDMGRDVTGPAQLSSGVDQRDPGIVGVVPAGATIRGAVAIRSVDGVLRKPLTLELAGPRGSGTIRVSRGIVLR